MTFSTKKIFRSHFWQYFHHLFNRKSRLSQLLLAYIELHLDTYYIPIMSFRLHHIVEVI